jgi:FkbM family methyltransferase
MKPFEESDRLNLPLDADSVVLDIGAHEGWFTGEIWNKFGCRIHAFEPVGEFYSKLAKRFPDNPKIRMWPFAVGDRTTIVEMGVKGDLTGVFCQDFNERRYVPMYDIAEAVDTCDIDHIDYVTINCEGGEYALLDRLIGTGMIKRIPYLSVQFHTVVPDYQARMERIIDRLKETHDHVYGSPFVWDGFTLR